MKTIKNRPSLRLTLTTMRCLLLFFCCQVFADKAARQMPQEWLIEDITLISPERQRPLKHAYVRLQGDKIIEVSSTPLPPNKATTRYNGAGQFLIPGLMDSHVHISDMPGLSYVGDDDSKKALQDAFITQQPSSYLYFGVTQLLDPSQSKAALRAFDRVAIKPDLFHCGATPIVGGYPINRMSQQTALKARDYLILEPSGDTSHIPSAVIKAHSPESIVANIKNDGAICVKLFIEDGFGRKSHWPLMSNAFMQRIKAAAKKHDLLGAVDLSSSIFNQPISVATSY